MKNMDFGTVMNAMGGLAGGKSGLFSGVGDRFMGALAGQQQGQPMRPMQLMGAAGQMQGGMTPEIMRIMQRLQQRGQRPQMGMGQPGQFQRPQMQPPMRPMGYPMGFGR
jgi:hypothetical protein